MAEKTLIKLALPQQADTAVWFNTIRDGVWPMLLESGSLPEVNCSQQNTHTGTRYDVVVANPVMRIECSHGKTLVHDARTSWQSHTDPFTTIKLILLKTPTQQMENIPFAGGALGYFAYDLGRYYEKINAVAMHDMPVPDLMVGIYDWAIIVDHGLQVTHLVSFLQYIDEYELKKLHHQLVQISPQANPSKKVFHVLGEVGSNLDSYAYAHVFAKIQSHINAGDCYQINLAQRFEFVAEGDAWQCYQQFKQLSRAPFMAYMDVCDYQGQSLQILCMSPERFLQVSQGYVETRPIKGTRPRGENAEEDQRIAQELKLSEKDKAENLMIVDLLRNDLSKVCELGSVKVQELFKLQTFANVHHLVSIVQGQLAPNYHALDVLKSCFPGGSITGAPKLSAMQIIECLEPHRRGVYCGSIGYIGFDGAMDTNIAIRTAVIMDKRMIFHAGGGVVTDSECEKEYQETYDKASSFFRLVQLLKQVRDPLQD